MVLKLNKILRLFLIYLTIVGLVTFSLFILEEAFQTAVFGTWAAQDAQDWQTVKDGVALMEGIRTTSKILNYSIGWIQPLAFLSYRAYIKSEDYYIAALHAKILAHEPELYIGERVTINFIPRSRSKLQTGEIQLRSGRVYTTVSSQPDKPVYRISGILKRGERGLTLN